MNTLLNFIVLPLSWSWRQRHRFIKFGLVGMSGIVINQATLWMCHEHLFSSIENLSLRLNLSMAVGILLSMTNNFHWNRRWTWKDRKRAQDVPVVHQYLQYAAANWAGIVTQVAITNLLTKWMLYLLANLFGIGVGCVVNFILNDLWTYRIVGAERIGTEAQKPDRTPMAMPLTVSGLVFSLCTYLYGLGSLHILRNGDELVYAQITRVTRIAKQWLPLVGIPGMRNTKPPLLFWQGLMSTDWGAHWSLMALRWPSVVWTFATAFLCGLLGWKLSRRDVFKGALAALFYLAFFSTYRYGRPYLTNPPETFWMFACFFTMLWWKPRSFDSRILFPTLLGVLAGMALLTKSFAQLLPIGVGLSWWHLHVRKWRVGLFVRNSLPGLIWMAVLSLGIFSLWFIFDPQPGAIWRDFVMGENVGKTASSMGAWFKGFLWGAGSSDSVWSLGGSWFFNAGLLAFPLFGMMVESWKHRGTLLDDERLLWIWVFAIFIVFCIPSQRSGRYLLEGMPALAVLMATRCHRVKRYTFVISLSGVMVVLLGLGWVSFLLAREVGINAFPWWHFPLVIAAIAFVVTAIARSEWTALCTPTAVLSIFLALSSFLSVFDGPLGIYDNTVISKTADRVVWVPEKFRSKAETHRFLLPRAIVRGYPAGSKVPDTPIRGPHDLMIVRLSLDSPAPAGAMGNRIDLTSRQKAWQIWEMAKGNVKKYLFAREYVVPADSLKDR